MTSCVSCGSHARNTVVPSGSVVDGSDDDGIGAVVVVAGCSVVVTGALVTIGSEDGAVVGVLVIGKTVVGVVVAVGDVTSDSGGVVGCGVGGKVKKVKGVGSCVVGGDVSGMKVVGDRVGVAVELFPWADSIIAVIFGRVLTPLSLCPG